MDETHIKKNTWAQTSINIFIYIFGEIIHIKFKRQEHIQLN